jgi:adenylate kinase
MLKQPILASRGYTQRKITENIDCEIFGVVLDEARESYAENIVRAMQSGTEADRSRNLRELSDWVRTFGADSVASAKPKKQSKQT